MKSAMYRLRAGDEVGGLSKFSADTSPYLLLVRRTGPNLVGNRQDNILFTVSARY